jgi:hypothetical protein
MQVDTSGAGDEAARAFAELTATLGEIEADYIGPQRGMTSASERAAGRYLVANALQHAFQCWFEVDPRRPLFQRWLGPTKKLLGDNPDALYYGAVVDPAGSYRIRGNVHGACYTSFSVEAGAQDGHLSKGVVATLNDTQFEIAADGSYELIASAEPQPRNWLRLEPDAGSITTRHYWEWERNAAADPTFHVPLWIEPVSDPGPAPPMDDAAIAAGIRRVVHFVRGATLDFPELPPEVMPAWVSNEVNRFDASAYDESNAEIGYAAVDNAYLQTRYEIGPDPYRHRRVSLNRRQVRYEPDGRFALVVAHRDPGVANWLDAAGLPTGMIFWRFLLPEENVPPIETELVEVDALRAGA